MLVFNRLPGYTQVALKSLYSNDLFLHSTYDVHTRRQLKCNVLGGFPDLRFIFKTWHVKLGSGEVSLHFLNFGHLGTFILYSANLVGPIVEVLNMFNFSVEISLRVLAIGRLYLFQNRRGNKCIQYNY